MYERRVYRTRHALYWKEFENWKKIELEKPNFPQRQKPENILWLRHVIQEKEPVQKRPSISTSTHRALRVGGEVCYAINTTVVIYSWTGVILVILGLAERRVI